MKKILITGANSYIGTSFEKYMAQWPEKYQVDTVDMIDGTWREKDFSGYDTVFHVAGIAHQKETQENAELYYKINRDLAFDTAVKAKTDGVKQFIFLSSMSVYGLETGVITKETVPTPKSNYGKSKLQAEEMLKKLEDDSFKVAILRPPMVYGKGCKGNFQTVIKIVRRFHVFPKVTNLRSMIYIENLCSFVKLCVGRELDGVYFPQNREYVKTIDIAEIVAEQLHIRSYFSYLLGGAVVVLRLLLPVAKKGFGNLIYKDVDEFDYVYCIVSNEDSLKKSV